MDLTSNTFYKSTATSRTYCNSSTCCLWYTYSNLSIKAHYKVLMVAAAQLILWRVECSQLAQLEAIVLNYFRKVYFCSMIVHQDEKQMQSWSLNLVLSFHGTSPVDNKCSTNPISHGRDTNYAATTLPEWHKQLAASHPINILYVLLFPKVTVKCHIRWVSSLAKWKISKLSMDGQQMSCWYLRYRSRHISLLRHVQEKV